MSELAELLQHKNQINQQIARLIKQPALIGHVGEYIVAQIFDIHLEESAAKKASDGVFQSGPLTGRSVNIKEYARQEGILDITPDALPDEYLVLSGPLTQAGPSRGMTRPWAIDQVYLFAAQELVHELRQSRIKIGVATSLAKAYREGAEIYPRPRNPRLSLSERAKSQLALFGSAKLV